MIRESKEKPQKLMNDKDMDVLIENLLRKTEKRVLRHMRLTTADRRSRSFAKYSSSYLTPTATTLTTISPTPIPSFAATSSDGSNAVIVDSDSTNAISSDSAAAVPAPLPIPSHPHIGTPRRATQEISGT